MAKKSKQENHFEQPTIWSKDKLALLKKLRRELESKERIQTDAKSSKQVTRKQFKPCSIVQRISGPNEGIEYLTDDTCTKATLGPYDQMLSQLAIYVGIGPAKLAIGMPRVPVGISTWQALSGMIGRVELSGITRKNAGSAKHHLMKQPWIMIACRERWVRDLYLSQRVRLSGESFKVSDFPAYRFGRNGQLKQISIAHPNYLSAPVVFYHFDQINCPKLNLEAGKVDLVLAEMSESNSRSCETWFTRLEQIRSILGDPKTILFFNSFDRRLRSCLIDNDYVIIDIRPQPQTNLDFSSVPTIHSTYSRYTYPEQVTVDIMTDQEISGALLDSARSIAKVAEEIKSIEGRQLIARYWILWRILKDIAIPMDIYERYRIHVQGRGSIESAIDRISNLVNYIQPPDSRLLRAVAPSIANSLKSVYKILALNCPKAGKLQAILESISAHEAETTLIILSEKAQVDALTERLLFDDVDILERLKITHLSQATSLARSCRLQNCILPGVWAPWYDSQIVALGSPNITVLMYPYEAHLLENAVQRHNDDCSRLSNELTPLEGLWPNTIQS